MWSVIKKNPISTFAVLMVAITLGYLIYMSHWETTVLTGSSWCARSSGLEKMLPGQTVQQALEVLKACNEMQKIQLEAVAWDSHIDHLTFSFVLILLSGVVIAGVKMAFKISKDGAEANVSKDVAAAAEHVVEGAKEAAAEVKEAKP